jgi:Flp pilus assembly protein TadG
MNMHLRGGTRRREEGASAVEFALVLPILAALLLGIIQFGWYFFVANNASSAAREGARRVVVGDCWGGAFQTFVKGQAPTTTTASYAPADLSSDSVLIGDQITVTVKADGALLSFIPWGASGGLVTREFTARLEDKTGGTCA